MTDPVDPVIDYIRDLGSMTEHASPTPSITPCEVDTAKGACGRPLNEHGSCGYERGHLFSNIESQKIVLRDMAMTGKTLDLLFGECEGQRSPESQARQDAYKSAEAAKARQAAYEEGS